MLLFNGCSAVLSIVAALLVWAGAALAVVTMPLCGCGVAVFHALLHTVFYLCCIDAFIYNALAATAADCIDMDLAEWGVSSSSTELHPLLPVRVPPPIAGRQGQAFEPCPRFERSLGTSSPRTVLAGVYFGCFKLLIGAGQMLAVVLVLGVLGFLIGDSRVPVHLDAMTAQHPFAVYTTAFGFLLVALALLHGTTRVAKVVTRFFCCETACSKALKNGTPATCWKCRHELALNQVEVVLSRSEFALYMRQPTEELRIAPCGHYYCPPCLLRMCRLALGDRALAPLRCCKKELPDDYVREALTGPEDYAKYQKIVMEKDWKISDLVSDAEYSATVKAFGAKQCPGCGIGVQRAFGCVHMSCPNGHQFCYTCLQRWGSCNCPLIPEDELRAILGE
uniref:RING-type domain-containing protein n=2 Tax=Phytophthora ramorum TaxID=164328 RepID=H3HCZ1_PHYRM